MPKPSPSDESDQAWYAPGLTFKCTQCGNCCTGGPGYVWFDDDEAAAMAQHLGLSESEFRRQYAHKSYGRWSLDEVRVGPNQFDCVFLERDEHGRGMCSIYPVRPTQCRTWPFWDSNLRNKQAWDESALDCPGMQRDESQGGEFVPVERIRVIARSNPKGL